MREHPIEAIGAYADGELPPEEARAVAAHLETCSECARELALIRAMGEAMREVRVNEKRSVWGAVQRRIARPAGWFLVVAGAVILAALGVVEWFRTGEVTLEWLAATGIGVGLALLVLSIGWEQYVEWKGSPYRDLER